MNPKELTAEPEVTLRLHALERTLINRHTEYHAPAGSWPVGIDLLMDLNSQLAETLRPEYRNQFNSEDNREAMVELNNDVETALANLWKVEAIVEEINYNPEEEI